MNTPAAYKVDLIRRAIADGQKPTIGLHGSDLRYAIAAMRNRNHTIIFTLDRGGGQMAVSPEEIQLVALARLPVRDDD